MATKERIKPPTRKALKDGSKQLRKRHASGGRVMADASVAKRQGVKRTAKRTTKRAAGKRG